MIKRQHHESDSLQAVQKMDFQSRVRELAFKNKLAANSAASAAAAAASSSVIVPTTTPQPAVVVAAQFQQTDLHVPIVLVNSKLDLFDSFQLNLSPAKNTTSLLCPL